jgi:DHA1 family tetracycline resistance protein-like MFS transporter
MSFIMVAVLIDMIAIGLMIPVLPHLVGSFTQSNDEQTLAFLAVTLTFGVANFVASPVLGALSDRYGRRPVLLIGFAGLALSFFITALATALWMLVAVRLFSGAMQSNMAIANAYVADISAPQERAKRFGQLGAMFGIGFILGPVVGGILGNIDLRLPFLVAGAMALLNLCYGWFVLPESLLPHKRRPFEWKRANPVSALRGLSALRGVGGPWEVGLSLFVVGVVMAFSQGVLMKPLLHRFSARRLAVIGMVSAACAYLGYGLATQGWMLYAIIFANVLAGVVAASMQSIVSNAADARDQGQTMGAVSSLNSLMAVAAPVVGLELLRWVAQLPPGHLLIGLPFYCCAALQLGALLIAARFFQRHPAPVAPAAA